MAIIHLDSLRFTELLRGLHAGEEIRFVGESEVLGGDTTSVTISSDVRLYGVQGEYHLAKKEPVKGSEPTQPVRYYP